MGYTQLQVLLAAAYREGNLIPVGTSPTAAETTEATERLNRIIQGAFGHEMGEELSDWQAPAPQRTAPIAANFPQAPFPTDIDGGVFGNPFTADPTVLIWPYPPKNSRIVFGGVTAKVYFSEAPEPGTRMALVQGSGAGDGGAGGAVLTIDGNGRTIQGANTQTFTDPVSPQQWFYDETKGDWALVQDMSAPTDLCPFPSDLDDLWITELSIRLGPRYTKVASPDTVALNTKMWKKFKARYRQDAPTTYNAQDVPRSLQSYISGRWFY